MPNKQDKPLNIFDRENTPSNLDHIFENVHKQEKLLQKITEPTILLQQNIPNLSIVTEQVTNTLNIVEQIQEPAISLLESQQRVIEMIEPIITQRQFMLSTLSSLTDTIENATKIQTTLLSSSLMQMVENCTANIAKIPIMDWIYDAVQPPLVSILDGFTSLIPKNLNIEHLNKLYLEEMYDARWFPYIGWDADVSLAIVIFEIIDSTRKSKNRTQKIDKAIFQYYTKTEIEMLRKTWRAVNISKPKLKILNHAVKAYHRKEYALTVSTLVALWEGIIAHKANAADNYRVGQQTNTNLKKLIEENDYNAIFFSFCEEFIFYTCRSSNDVKDDVPGRHGIAHSWYEKYPNKKMALNAILFTDFLLKLEPLPIE